MGNIESYVVTGNNFPEWLMNGTKNGIVRVVKDDDGNFVHIAIESPSGRKIAKKDDVIIKTKSGYSVVTGEQAKKYRVTYIPKPKKVEVKNNEVEE